MVRATHLGGIHTGCGASSSISWRSTSNQESGKACHWLRAIEDGVQDVMRKWQEADRSDARNCHARDATETRTVESNAPKEGTWRGQGGCRGWVGRVLSALTTGYDHRHRAGFVFFSCLT